MTYEECGILVLNKLIENNFSAYIVGGYVRDKLLGIDSMDIDIATSATPQEVIKIFDKTYLSGLKFNGVSVKIEDYIYEITTFRKDLVYLDNRHPIIETSKTLNEDLERRDYTINAIAMDKDGNLLCDNLSIEDLNNKVIRAVGDPNKRFKEDSLRILRGFYLVSKLDFNFEEETLKSIKEDCFYLSNVSYYRVYNELNKIIGGKHNLKALKLMLDCNVFDYLDSLKEGTKYIVKNNIEINDTLTYLIVCFYFNKSIGDKFLLSKEQNKYIKEMLSYIDIVVDDYILFLLKLEKTIHLNLIKKLLNKEYMTKSIIEKRYDNLIVKDYNSLAINTSIIISTLNKKPDKWIKEVQKDLIIKINDKTINNNKEDIIDYLKGMVKYAR